MPDNNVTESQNHRLIDEGFFESEFPIVLTSKVERSRAFKCNHRMLGKVDQLVPPTYFTGVDTGAQHWTTSYGHRGMADVRLEARSVDSHSTEWSRLEQITDLIFIW